MERIRLGNNIAISWALYDLNGRIHSLEDKEVQLYVSCGGLKQAVTDYTIQGNVVSWVFLGTEQKKVGLYKLILVETDALSGAQVVDVADAFRLVSETLSAVETGEVTKNVSVRSVLTYSNLVGVESVDVVESSEDDGINLVSIRLVDGNVVEIPIKNGSKGDTGATGATGATGPKGDKGDIGERGPAGINSVEAAIGTNDPTQAPSVDKELTEGVLSLTFNNIKGEKGDKGDKGNTGSSVDFPYELVTDVETDDDEKGLAASQGVVLDNKISQLGQKVDEIDYDLYPIYYDDDSHINNKERIDFVDNKNEILATISEDGIKTKNFDSTESAKKSDIGVVVGKLVGDDEDAVIIQDENNNILATISEDGIKTKNFDSSRIEDNSGEVTIKNSDCITILGSSFGETDVFPTNKHWSGIMSLFSDYVIQNLSLSGSNIVTDLYKIRTGEWDIRGKYVAITNNENINGMDITQYVQALDNLCSTLKGLNKIPIICTNYHKAPYFCLALKKYAYDNNLLFWDASDYCHTLVPAIYGGFDDGAHLRKRNAPMVADAYLNNMHEMSAPFSSIKLFTLRDSGFSGSIDNLIYNNNVERAKLFREIKISSTQAQDEYNKIISKTSVSFGKYGTIDCVLPTFARQLKELWLELDTNNTAVSVYVKNTLAEPYPNPSTASAVRFSISDSIDIPMEGDVYSVGGVNYTISQIVMGENGYYCTIYCTPATLPASATGTLSVVSRVEGSTGASSISYALAEIATLNIGSYISSDNQGHWVSLTLTDGKYEVPSTLFNGAVQNDKVSFLIVATSTSFSIKDVSLHYSTKALKNKNPDGKFEWYENDYLHTDELIAESTFGEVGTELTSWVDDNDSPIVSVGDYGSKYPFGASSIVKVTDALAMNTTITETELNKFGKAVLEICCRYFPNAPTPYSQGADTAINDNSYDYNTLFITMTHTHPSEKIVLQEEIGVMWKIVRIPLTWFWQFYDNSAYLYKSISLRLSSNNMGIEIAKVSLKYV